MTKLLLITDGYSGILRSTRLARAGSGDLSWQRSLLWRWLNGASALQGLGSHDAASDYCDEAIGIYRILIKSGREDYGDSFARALTAKATGLSLQGLSQDATEYFDDAIDIHRRAMKHGKRPDLTHELASMLSNKSYALVDLEKYKEAMRCSDEAVRILRHAVDVDLREELTNDLAVTLLAQANGKRSCDDPDGAIELYDEVISIFRAQYQTDERNKGLNQLASALYNKAVALNDLDRDKEALACYDEAIQLLQTCISQGMVGLTAPLEQATIRWITTQLAVGDFDRLAELTLIALQHFEKSAGNNAPIAAQLQRHRESLEKLMPVGQDKRAAFGTLFLQIGELLQGLADPENRNSSTEPL